MKYSSHCASYNHAQNCFGPVSFTVHKHQTHILEVTHWTCEKLHKGISQPIAGQHFHSIFLNSCDTPVQGLLKYIKTKNRSKCRHVWKTIWQSISIETNSLPQVKSQSLLISIDLNFFGSCMPRDKVTSKRQDKYWQSAYENVPHPVLFQFTMLHRSIVYAQWDRYQLSQFIMPVRNYRRFKYMK